MAHDIRHTVRFYQGKPTDERTIQHSVVLWMLLCVGNTGGADCRRYPKRALNEEVVFAKCSLTFINIVTTRYVTKPNIVPNSLHTGWRTE